MGRMRARGSSAGAARTVLTVLMLLSTLHVSIAIYEDQIGKLDWRQTYVGRIKLARPDTVSVTRKVIVATEENVLAALNLKTGQIVWRRVLESEPPGTIQMLHVSDKVVTVTGINPYLVRGWDSTTGVLLWEWSMSLQNAERAAHSSWWVQQGSLVHLMPVFGSHLEVTMYNAMTGHNRGNTQKISAAWANEGCVLSPPYYTCMSGDYGSQYLFSLDVTSSTSQFITKPLSSYVDWATSRGVLRELDGASAVPAFLLDNKILVVQGKDFEVMETEVEEPSASVAVVDSANGPLVLQMWNKDKTLHLRATKVNTGKDVPEISFSVKGLDIPEPELAAAFCTRTPKEQNACRFLATGDDDSAVLLQQAGRVHWTREEALANIVAVEFVDLPVSELDAAIESEFDHKEGDILGALTRRLHTQAQQLVSFAQSVVRAVLRGARGEEISGEEEDISPLVRDYFDLHKIILAVTEAGKIFGIDNLSGAVLWSRSVEGLMGERSVAIYLRRSARHPPHDAHVTIIGSHSATGNGLLVSLNPITGVLVAEGVLHLDYRLKQTALLPRPDAELLRGIVLLDETDSVQVLPVSAAPMVVDFYLYVAEQDTTKVQGYALKYDGRVVNAVKTWSLVLGGSAEAGHRIVRAVPRSPLERVHSHGKVMGDRSVLYKYINPNLVVFITEGPELVHKDVMHVTCVDVVSGAVVAAHAHRRARALPHAVHADNFVAYAYLNEKQRRTEIATVELYEGRSRSLPPGAAFSSLAEQLTSPLVERQTYILPATLTAMAATITERGITDKHILLSLSSGAILEMPWAYLEPRRPLSTPTAEHREEGLLQYAPELPLPSEAALNYNQTLHRTRAIHTAPSGLESTCLVFAYGLDVFYTRVAPSKTFDLLKEDFDYHLITLVLAALTLATYSSKYFATRKMLKQAWK